ncbi:MAG: FISUMP domain-containing protein [Bacteroidota bacterium]
MSSEIKQKKENFNYTSINDIENNSYRTIKIKGGILGADQEWFADNLNVSSFKNGDAISQAQEFMEWKDACERGIPAWCYYEDNKNLGKIYNLAAIMDPRGLAPEGYKIPDRIDFSILGLNAQEYEPVEKNCLKFSTDMNFRTESFGMSSGAKKLISKEYWKKKGKNSCGLNIIGSGQRIGNSYKNGFHNFEILCSLWLKPSGWNFKKKENGESLGWHEFNQINQAISQFKIDDDSFFRAVANKDEITISKEDFDVYRLWSQKNILPANLWFDPKPEILTDFYPLRRKEEVSERDFNYAIGCILSVNNFGLRTANFTNGKDQIWFTMADYETGAYVRPFKYI